MSFNLGSNIFWTNYLCFPNLYSGHNPSYLTELTELDLWCLQSTQHKALCKANPETTWKLLRVCSLPSLPGNWSHHEHEVNGLGRGSPHFSLVCLPHTVWWERLELSPPLLSQLHYHNVNKAMVLSLPTLQVSEAKWHDLGTLALTPVKAAPVPLPHHSCPALIPRNLTGPQVLGSHEIMHSLFPL